MPTRPLGPCGDPTCPERATNRGYCATHRAARTAEYEEGRGSSSARGYDRKWRAYRTSFLGDLANLYCAGYPGVGTCLKTSTEVDHIVPVKGPEDPLFWEPTNHQGLCHDCHSRKTVVDGRWTGRGR